ncbi:unnamed protein product [Cladocopium goreaui]|uniref:Voltage-dependent T-type calcium channel subunit alpha-1H n=1 Tax=Cladocopium goreaui TaxID=2562237 RepID=A0A9P1CAY9_9DINO|nr:unnamed protein product [Cladocopium goreaui]
MAGLIVALGETVQFAIPEKDELDPDPRTPEPPALDGRDKSPRNSVNTGISPAFLSLVDQLVHQHKIEVATSTHRTHLVKSFELPSAATTDMDRLVSSASESPSGKPRHSVSTDEESKTSSRMSNGAKGTSQSLKPQHHLQRSPTVARVMCHHHGDLKEMNASKILDAFDMQKLLEKDDTDALDIYQDPRTSKKLHLAPSKTNASFQTFDWDEMEDESCLTKLQVFMQSTRYEFTISIVLALNVLWMAIELELEGTAAGVPLGIYDKGINVSDWTSTFRLGDSIFAYIFIADVLLRILVLRSKFFQVWLNYVDMAVSITSLAEIILSRDELELPIPPQMFKLLRIGKLARAIRMITMTTMMLSLQLLIKCLAASRGMLFWSFCLMSFVQCVAGMILATLCQDFVQDTARDPKIREEVFRYYGTFTRTFLSMFEILFANWSPPCRILVENVNEWFSVFFLIYRCVLGFAVINVVNSVFVQQTMKTASSDEDLAFRQKQKDIAAYTRKVRKLFQTMDQSGDGTLNLEEFAKLVTNPKLKFWMSQLELEYHDLMSLFEFLDNGETWQRSCHMLCEVAQNAIRSMRLVMENLRLTGEWDVFRRNRSGRPYEEVILVVAGQGNPLFGQRKLDRFRAVSARQRLLLQKLQQIWSSLRLKRQQHRMQQEQMWRQQQEQLQRQRLLLQKLQQVEETNPESPVVAKGTESSSVSGNPAVPTSVKAETMLPALDVVMSLQAALPHLSRAAAADVKAALQALGTPLTLEAGLSSSKVSADAVVEASSSCATTSKVPAGTAIEASSSSSKVLAEAVVEANSSCATTSKVPAGTAMEVSPSSVKSAAGAVVEATGGTATKASSSVSKLAAETVVEVVTLELRSLEQRLNYGSVSAGAMDEAKEAMAKELAEQQVQLEQRREEVVKLEESLEVAQAREGLATAWQLYCEHFADGQCDVASKTDDFLRDFLTRALS